MEEDDLLSEGMSIDSEQSVGIEDMEEDDYTDSGASGAVALVRERYSKASTAREVEEHRWIRAYRNYRGLYGPDVQFTSTEKSQVFVKVTKTKTLAAYGQIVEVLFGNSKFPITVDPTTLPEGVAESVQFETNPEMDEAKGKPLMPLNPGETSSSLKERLAGLEESLAPVEDKLKEGVGTFQPKVYQYLRKTVLSV